MEVKETFHSTAHSCTSEQQTTINEDPIEEGRPILNMTNLTIYNINKACLEQLKALWRKMLLHLDGIVSFCVLAICEQNSTEERLLRQLKATEFTALFARNYVYSLRRKMQELHELVDAARVVHQNARSANKTNASLIAAHQAANNALAIYLKRMPCPVGEGVPDKLSELLQLIIEMCAMCTLFAIERDELKKGPCEVERKCKCALIQIKDQRNQCLTRVNEKHNTLPMDNKKISYQKTKKKLSSKHYSLAMYKPTAGLPLRTIPKGYKFKIKNLAKVKFGPPPKKPSESKPLKAVTNEHKAWKRHHTETVSPQRNTQPKQTPIRPSHDDNIELTGKFDDSDNIHTMVELFSQKEMSNHLEANQLPICNNRIKAKEGVINQMKERIEELPEHNMVDIAVNTATTGEGNISKQQPVKLGAANAQLILLPPYEPPSNKQVIVDLQDDTIQGCSGTSRQERLQQQRYNQSIHTEHCIQLPKLTGELNTNSQLHHNVSTEELISQKYNVQDVCYQNKCEPSHKECLQTLPSCSPTGIHLISAQSRVIESINSSILDLKTSHANMNQLLVGIQKQQQQVIEAKAEVPQTVLESTRHDNVLVQSNSSAASLHVSHQQLSEVFKYVNQCEGLLKTAPVKKLQLKPWRVLDVLSNQVVETALRSVVAELDFESLLSNMYRLEFQ